MKPYYLFALLWILIATRILNIRRREKKGREKEAMVDHLLHLLDRLQGRCRGDGGQQSATKQDDLNNFSQHETRATGAAFRAPGYSLSGVQKNAFDTI